MSKTLNSPTAALQIIWIGVLLITMSSFTYVSTQPTVDDDEAYCQSRTLEDLVREMRADIKTSCQSGPHAVVLKIFIKYFLLT